MAGKLIEAMSAYGCDVNEALARMMNNESLYVRFAGKFLDDPSFEQSKANVLAGDSEEALKSVHTLKGVSGNLGFTPLFKVASEMVTLYRSGEPDKAAELLPELERIYGDICSILKDNQ